MSEENQNKKGSLNMLPVIIGAVLVIAAVIAIVVYYGGKGGDTSLNSAGNEITAGGELVIKLSDVSDTASFYPVTVDGVDMEVIAIRAADGTVRTAFNTCQSCYTSGNGYYQAEQNELVCQNCGFHFTAEQVETSAGGCNPYPIFENDKTVTDDEIHISYDVLKASNQIFANWRK